MATRARRGWIGAVVVPTAVAVGGLAALVGLILQLSIGRSDTLALERQKQLVSVAMREAVSGLANDQEASTLWDDAVRQVRRRPLDLVWIDNNLGIWFNTYYQHDEVYLLDPADRPLYAMQGGRRAPPTTFARVADEALELAGRLRRQLRAGEAVKPGEPGQTLGARDVELLAGRPAIVSVKPIVSETGSLPQVAGNEYLHVSVRYLDGSFLRQLATKYRIDNARFVPSPGSAAAMPVRSNEGVTLGYLAWSPFQPGSQVAQRLAPALALALLVIGTVIAALLWRNWRGRIELEASRAHAQHLAFHDPLTGLPNRALFDERLGAALRRGRGDRALAVLLLDLDRFKNINDTFGHQVGDALIRDFGARFSVMLREGDMVARFGGDEFAILIEDWAHADVEDLCRRLLNAVQRPFAVPGGEVHVGVSIGVAVAPPVGGDSTELIRQADIALYRAKEDGRNTYRLFKGAMDHSVKLRSNIEKELRHALESGEGLSLHFQPTVAVPEGRITGIEALVRWRHPTRGAVAPEIFVAVAEESGLIDPLGEWILREACRVAARRPGPFMSVNLSPVQFRAQRFVEQVIQTVTQAGTDPAGIQLEITERVLLADDAAVQNSLRRLREAGFRIALDDFGTGYSSLSYLHKFAVDKIKIDQSFVRGLGTADDSSGIVMAVLALGKAMNLAVAAEGVETVQQRDFLAKAGCVEMQGNLFSASVPEEELDRMFADSMTWAVVA